MFYANKLSAPKTIKYQTIEYDFDKNFDCDNEINDPARDCPILNINFKSSNNCLTNSYGEVDFFCTYSQNGGVFVNPAIGELSKLKGVKYFVSTDSIENSTKKRMIVESYDNIVYYSNLNDGSSSMSELVQLDSGCTSKMFTYYYNLQNYLLISTKLDEVVKYYVIDSSFQMNKYEDVPHIYDICSHNNMLFMVLDDDLRTQIYYTDDSNPLNLVSNSSNMNILGLPLNKGKVMKLISYDDYLYAVCEYGVIRIVSYKTQEELFVEEVYSCTARIIENSVVLGEDKIIFADINNMYILDGNSVDRIEFNFKSLYQDVLKWRSCACFNDGKYYLSTRINYSDGIAEKYDEEKNNCLIIYDLTSKKFEVCCDMSYLKMEVYHDEAQSRIAVLSGELKNYSLKTLSDNGLFNGSVIARKVYRTEYKNLNSDDIKIIRNFKICTSEDITVKLDCDSDIYEYSLSGSDEEQTIVVNKRTRIFGLTIESKTSNPEIKNLKVLVGKYE